jgi:hypothetical protein
MHSRRSGSHSKLEREAQHAGKRKCVPRPEPRGLSQYTAPQFRSIAISAIKRTNYRRETEVSEIRRGPHAADLDRAAVLAADSDQLDRHDAVHAAVLVAGMRLRWLSGHRRNETSTQVKSRRNKVHANASFHSFTGVADLRASPRRPIIDECPGRDRGAERAARGDVRGWAISAAKFDRGRRRPRPCEYATKTESSVTNNA